MGKIKIKHVVQVEIYDEVDDKESGVLPLDDIYKNVAEGLTPALKSTIEDEFLSDNGRVVITQMYADAWRCEDDED